jgi:ATP-dependent protease ClpP protease subunit
MNTAEAEVPLAEVPEEFEQSGDPLDLVRLHLDNNINLVTNTLSFTGEFTLESIELLINRMDFLQLYNPGIDINLRISSYGGEAYALLSIIDYIHSLPVKVNGFVIGVALSSAAYLFMALTGVRSIGKHGTLLIHEGASGVEGKISDMTQTMKQME